jgi:hypothetical protein
MSVDAGLLVGPGLMLLSGLIALLLVWRRR